MATGHVNVLFGCGLSMLALVACGGSDDPAVPPAPPAPTIGSAALDAAGGIVDGPDGVQLVVPSGALAAPTTFRISRDASGAPALEGINALSPVYAATPHGQTFNATALLSIPLSAAQIPAGATPVLLKAEPGGKWRVMPTAVPTRRAWRRTSGDCRSSSSGLARMARQAAAG